MARANANVATTDPIGAAVDLVASTKPVSGACAGGAVVSAATVLIY
jgi:hypothetical protein